MTTTIDPVCGKLLTSGQSAIQLEYDQQIHRFCSERCRDLFAADPEHYLGHVPAPVCGECGGAIRPDDVVCPHCGTSLAAG